MTFAFLNKLPSLRGFQIRMFASGVVMVSVSFQVFSAESQILKPSQTQTGAPVRGADARIYTHPTRGYTLAIPPGSEILERGDGDPQVAIRSHKGYKITLQAGTTRHSIPLRQLPSILEERYFGKGKPWRHRLEDRLTKVAKMDAYEVIYEGASNRSRVIFVRGKKTDYVFIYLAGLREYGTYSHEFEWVLKSFTPPPGEILAPKMGLGTGAKSFSKAGYGYVLRYPSKWELSEAAQMAVMFSGPVNTPAYSAIVSVQNVEPPGAKSPEDSVLRATRDLKASLAQSVPDAIYTADRPWIYRRGKLQLPGRELRVGYIHDGQKFRKSIFIVPRRTGTIAHIWSYTAPEQNYKTFEPIAEQMLASWTLQE